jgi:hypothetical protein
VTSDPAIAKEWFTPGGALLSDRVKARDASATHDLACLYVSCQRFLSGKKDLENGLSLMRKAAELGDSRPNTSWGRTITSNVWPEERKPEQMIEAIKWLAWPHITAVSRPG